jgi:hypothetical protein
MGTACLPVSAIDGRRLMQDRSAPPMERTQNKTNERFIFLIAGILWVSSRALAPTSVRAEPTECQSKCPDVARRKSRARRPKPATENLGTRKLSSVNEAHDIVGEHLEKTGRQVAAAQEE